MVGWVARSEPNVQAAHGGQNRESETGMGETQAARYSRRRDEPTGMAESLYWNDKADYDIWNGSSLERI